MTTIAAIQGNGWAVAAYDSQITTEEDRIFTLPKASGKMLRNGEYLLGVAGDMRAINLLSHVFKPPSPGPGLSRADLDRFMTSKFVPALKTCFESVQYGEKGEQGSTVVVILHSIIYEIGSNYEWCHSVDGIYSVGSGAGYSLGALYHGIGSKKSLTITQAKNLAKNSVAISSKLDTNTGGPIYVVSQTTKEFR